MPETNRRASELAVSRVLHADRLPLLLLGAALLLVTPGAGAQSLSYTRGQNISPAYEGWEQASDGSKYFLFGYMNRNWEEEIDVPVGPDNGRPSVPAAASACVMFHCARIC